MDKWTQGLYIFLLVFVLIPPVLALKEPIFKGSISEETKEYALNTLYRLPVGCFIGVEEIIFYENNQESRFCTSENDGCLEWASKRSQMRIHIGSLEFLRDTDQLRGLLYHEACGHGIQHRVYGQGGKLEHNAVFRRGIQMALNWIRAEQLKAFWDLFYENFKLW